jgi:hypothetical protein
MNIQGRMKVVQVGSLGFIGSIEIKLQSAKKAAVQTATKSGP